MAWGQKVDDVSLPHFSGGLFSGEREALQLWIPLGLVEGVEESPVEFVTWLKVTWAGRMEAPKLVGCCCFLLLGCSGKPFLEAFLAIVHFFSGSSRMGFVLGCEEDPVKVVVWLAIVWAVGRRLERWLLDSSL